ncbi:hypothetical protein HKX48_003720 [Thoreauomyces humboldtii]|nr:hypothetical protein HKX48_003720 [Thoreauomyces humboldtii]
MAPPKKQRQYRKKDTLDDPAEPETHGNGPTDQPAFDEDTTSSVLAEALELRQFRRRAPGMDITDLNRGDRKLAAKRAAAEKEKEVEDDPWKLKSGGGLVNMEEVRGRTFAGEEAPQNTSVGGGFSAESNAMDTERHMRDFIEKEMQKRRGDVGEATAAPAESLDPHDELFQIPDHLKTIEKPVSEGNVTLSTSMLTAIPEIDLGISSKLRNIEETERAKRLLVERNILGADGKRIGSGAVSDLAGASGVAAERYWTGHKFQQRRDDDRSDQRNSDKRKSAGTGGGGNESQAGTKKKTDRRNMATDEMVMERFKKRIRRN